ncbi:uncharacterized protein LOC143592785 [Bidens hawaiensis]|uniref:uncharacterized protein LOC143592785 n=1 Tax=Bidens hawaiensis TaxID=980011 RepID=UPI00404947CE
MVEKFLLKYFPPDKNIKYRASITGFRTDEDESLHAAWERYKSLLRRCPHHGLNKWLQVQTFFDAQSSQNKQAIDQIAGGDLGTKSPNKAFEVLEKAAKKSFAYNPPRSRPSHKGMHQVDSNTFVIAQFEALSKKFEQLQTELVKAKNKCDTCGGEHKTNYYQQSMMVEEVDFVSRQNNSYGNSYNPGWRSHPNFSWKDGANNQAPHGFEKRHFNQNQTYQPKPQYHNQEQSTSQQTTNETTTNSLLTQLLANTETANKIVEKRNRLTEERFQKNEIELRNQRAHLQNIENQVGQLAQLFSERQLNGLPNNTVNNPNAAVNAVTLGSGRTTMVTEPTSEPMAMEKETEIPEEVQERLVPASTAQPKELVRTYIPPIPYPARLKKERLEAQYGKFLELFKQLHINIPFVEALSQMPKYTKFLKDVLTNKRKLEELSHVTLNEECSAILQNKLPEKMTDPGSFTIPCLIGRIGEPKTTRMSIQLADRSIKYPRGIVENMLVKIDKFVFPVDFVILDMDEDKNVPLILERPFLATARALIDVCTGKLTLRVNDEQVTFDIGRYMQHPQHHDDSLYCIDVIDSIVSCHMRVSAISNVLDTQILEKPISEPIREDHIVEEVIDLED